MTWSEGPVTVLVGDVREQLQSLADAGVQCVVTSPPYWGLRDYGTGSWVGGDPGCDHVERQLRTGLGLAAWSAKHGRGGGHKAGEVGGVRYRAECARCGARRVDPQLGLEATPEEYVAALVAVFREVRRVLRPDGTVWLNLGDSYWGGGGGNYADGKSVQGREGVHLTNVKNRYNPDGLKPKDLVMIPARVALALQADGWWLRSDIVWSKPNPMPESVSDRPTTSHEHVFLLTRSARYYYDQEAVREPSNDLRLAGQTPHRGFTNGNQAASGRNLRSVWTIATQPYPEAHFATFPERLAEICIAAGTSERGCCPECGAPWRRMVERRVTRPGVGGGSGWAGRSSSSVSSRTRRLTLRGGGFGDGETRTVGWGPTCRCEAGEPVPSTVLDPFAGSGTTLAVARRLDRRAIGIELQREYLPLIQRRVSKGALPLLEAISGR